MDIARTAPAVAIVEVDALAAYEPLVLLSGNAPADDAAALPCSLVRRRAQTRVSSAAVRIASRMFW
jgi:hypothetical protein